MKFRSQKDEDAFNKAIKENPGLKKAVEDAEKAYKEKITTSTKKDDK